MPQSQRVAWAQLRVGITVLVALILFAVGIFFVSGQIGFLSRRYTLKMYTAEAGGLREGAQVRLAGVPVGNVEHIKISRYPERSRAVDIELSVARTYQDDIRADSTASIQTAGLLGESYVDISRGSFGQEVVPDQGVLQAAGEADIKQAVHNANDAIVNLRTLTAQLGGITGEIQSGKGTVGKLIYDQTLYNRLNKTTGSLDAMVTGLEHGQGTLGKLLADETLYTQTVATINRLNKVMDQLQNGQGTLAKLLTDPSMYNTMNHMVGQANSLVSGLNQGQGTLGLLVKDPQLYNRLNSTLDHLNGVSTRMDSGQGTLGLFSTNPALYNNLNQSSESLRDFLTEFRKNPKKYLTVKVKIF